MLERRLLDLAVRLTGALVAEEIEEVTVSLLAQAAGASGCAIVRLSPEGGLVSAAYAQAPAAGTSLSPEECLALSPFQAAEEAQVVRHGQQAGLDQLLRRFGAESALLCPMPAEEGVPALLVLGYSGTQVPLDRDDMILCSALGRQTTAALNNARRHRQVQRQLQDLRLLHRVATAANTASDLDGLLHEVVDALCMMLEVEVCGFLVVDRSAGVLRGHPSCRGFPGPVEGLVVPLGQGVTGHVAQTGEALLLPDVTREPRYLSLGSEGIRSEVCVPVVVGGQAVAVLNLESRRPNAFDESDLGLLSTVAGQLAMAMGRAQLLWQSRRQVRELAALMRVSVDIQRATRLTEILDVLIAEALSLVGREYGFVLLLDGQAGLLRVAASRGLSEDLITGWNRQGIPAAWGPFGQVLQAGELLEVLDTAADPRVEPGLGPLPAQLTLVPLKTDQGVIGILVLDAIVRDSTSRRLLQAMAELAAVAIERARLLEDTRQRLEEGRFLQEVALAVTSTLDFDEVLRRSVRALEHSLQFEIFGFLVVDERAGLLRLHPTFIGVPKELDGFTVRIGEGITGWVAKTGEPYMTGNVQDDPHYLGAIEGIRSEMCVPVKVGDRVIAVIDLESVRPEAFGQKELHLISSMARQLAIALENARRFGWEKDFISTINHEIRAPLTAILGFTDYILREHAGPLTPAQREYLGDVRSSGERILSLVDNLLDAARLDEGQARPQCKAVRVEEVISRTMAMFQPAAMEKDIALDVRLAADLPDAWADPTMVERILMNLLSNAIKFTPAGGSVWVEAGLSEREADTLEVRVGDTGVGIAPEHHEEVFQRYRRLETPGVGKVSGTGLGLYIVKGLVEAHGGWIDVESAVGRGSVFTFTLPTLRRAGEELGPTGEMEGS